MINKSVEGYFDKLSRLFREIEVTDGAGLGVPFSEGMDRLMRRAVETHQRENKLIFIGNGGSAAIASHMAIDYWKNGGIRATAFNDPSLLTCLSNDYGYEHVFEKPISMLGQKGDLIVAISSSGRSPNILQAVQAGREIGAEIITLSGFQQDNPLRGTGDINFYVASSSYGFVEISHLSICHAALDLICESRILS